MSAGPPPFFLFSAPSGALEVITTGSTATIQIRALSLHDLALGYQPGGSLPLDFMERMKTHTGQVSLGAGWERIADAFKGSSYFVATGESDLLWLDAEHEAFAIEYLEGVVRPGDATFQESVADAIEALVDMRAEREALGLENATWELG